jgi:hypothetical protein
MARSNALNFSNDTLLRAYAGATGGGAQPPNGLINGSMNVNQRGTTSQAANIATATYFLDGWKVGNSGTSGTAWVISQGTGPTGGKSLLYTRPSGVTTTTNAYVYQSLPSALCSQWAGLPLGLTFSIQAGSGNYVNKTASGYFAAVGAYSTQTTGDVDLFQASPTGFTQFPLYFLGANSTVSTTIPTTWTTYTVNLGTLPSNVTQVALKFNAQPSSSTASVANDTVAISNIYLAPIAAPVYVPESQAVEFARCQQQYYTTYQPGVTPGTASAKGAICFSTTNTLPTGSAFGSVQFPVPMLYSPTVTFYSYQGTAGSCNQGAVGSDQGAGSAAAYSITPRNVVVYSPTVSPNGSVALSSHCVANCSL